MTREDPRYFELVTAVREALAHGHGAGRRPLAAEKRRERARRREPAAATPRAWRQRRAGEWLPALIVFAIGIAAWEWIFSPLAGKFLLPRPSTIASALWDNRHLLWDAGWYTFKEALGGFVAGSRRGDRRRARARALAAASATRSCRTRSR